jgi:hypothetical protein
VGAGVIMGAAPLLTDAIAAPVGAAGGLGQHVL